MSMANEASRSRSDAMSWVALSMGQPMMKSVAGSGWTNHVFGYAPFLHNASCYCRVLVGVYANVFGVADLFWEAVKENGKKTGQVVVIQVVFGLANAA